MALCDVKPTMSISGLQTGDQTATLGKTYTLVLGSLTDPDSGTVEGYTVDWGDETQDYYLPAELPAEVTHKYFDYPDVYEINVSVTDEYGVYENCSNTLPVDVGPFLTDVNSVTFDAAASDCVRVADFGLSSSAGGTLSFSTTVPSNPYGHVTFSIDDAGNGFIKFIADNGDCPAGTYSIVLGYTYGGHSWSQSISVHVASATDMPPVFPTYASDATTEQKELGFIKGDEKIIDVILNSDDCYYDNGVYYYTDTNTTDFLAYDREDATLDYSPSEDAPDEASIDEYGVFSCEFTEADAGCTFDFIVTATDSGGNSDSMRAIICVVLGGYGSRWPAIVEDSATIVDMNTSDNVITINNNVEYGESYRYLVLIIDSEPTNGDIIYTPTTSGGITTWTVTYTPDPDYNGRDSFTYHYEYKYFDDGIYVDAYTSTATANIQVGPLCALTTSGISRMRRGIIFSERATIRKLLRLKSSIPAATANRRRATGVSIIIRT